MSGFSHYMYVLECVDGSLYTGYTTDVAARVRAHNAGKGAKYTRARCPVSLLAQARFYTKHQAMSAEYHFKRLTRDAKDVLLARAALEPFEAVLADAVPALATEPVGEWVARELCTHADAGYRDFMAQLLPSVDSRSIVGVRTPQLRRMARALAARDDLDAFMRDVPHRLFEENQLHAFVAGGGRDFETAVARIQDFLPYVDNWATCDQLPTTALAQDLDAALPLALSWVASEATYTSRFGMGVLMHHYLTDRFDPAFLQVVAARRMPGYEQPAPASEAYYHDMMRAWFFAEAVALQPAAAMPVLEGVPGAAELDLWTRRKAIQKCLESYRVSDATKAHLREVRAAMPRGSAGGDAPGRCGRRCPEGLRAAVPRGGAGDGAPRECGRRRPGEVRAAMPRGSEK